MGNLTPRKRDVLARRLEPAIRRAFEEVLAAVPWAVGLSAVPLRTSKANALLNALGLDVERFSLVVESRRWAFIAGNDVGMKDLQTLVWQQARRRYDKERG